MRHRKVKKQLGRSVSATNSMLRSLAASLVLHEKIKTTDAKAKLVRPLVEKAITAGKKPTLAARRKLLSFFYTDHPVKKIFEVLSPRYASRPGGYTRITKLGHRPSDGADIVQIELIK
ncbi:50S ribosomal protein L17 [Candidatus Uhrbacteria bacterium]|nr:50S ribosomal protein L17 [Candidatus Uhrbacteria bacterium]